MFRNIEIKAKTTNIDTIRAALRKLTELPRVIMQQEDTFFHTTSGRLKLRQVDGYPAELIHYDRPDQKGPKLSSYEKQVFQNVDEVEGLKKILKKSLKVRGVVRKQRELYVVDQTRVHLDNVEKLGIFIELEVCLKEHQSIEEGQNIANVLMKQLDVKDEDLVSYSYIDMLTGTN